MYRYLIILLLLFPSCNTQEVERPDRIRHKDNLTVFPEDVEPKYSIEFEHVQSFEPILGSNDDIYIGSMENFAVDDSNRVYIYSGSKIHVLGPNGNYLTAMGGEGSGPGEIHNYAAVQPRTGMNLLYAYDTIQQRINVYSLQTFSPVHTILMEPDNWNSIEELKLTKSRPDTRFYIKVFEILPVELGGRSGPGQSF